MRRGGSRDESEAVAGLQRVFEKYEAWARRALRSGDLTKARGYVDKMRGLAPEAPAVRELGEAIARLERQREDEARIAAKEEAQRRADEARFQQAESKGTVAAYERYVRAGPDGRRVPEAMRRIEELRKRTTVSAGERFRDCEECPWMVVVPAGRITVGDSTYEHSAPPHEVIIGERFAVGVFEVTVEEFSRFVAATDHEMVVEGNRSGPETDFKTVEEADLFEASRYDTEGMCFLSAWVDFVYGKNVWMDPKLAQTDGHPVVCVNWEDAKAYASWLSHETGMRYRLPSESEWEYAARGGATTARYWGEDASGQCRHANGADRAMKRRHQWHNIEPCDDGALYTAAVGSYTTNGFGLYDVLGNASEWVEDCWHENYDGAPHDGTAWIVGGNCEDRVIRGGAWDHRSWQLTLANRRADDRTMRENTVGFRVARDLAP